MSNYNSFIIPSIKNNSNGNESNCLEQYYRYIVGMSMNHNNNNNNNLVDQNEYQKIYVDTLVGKKYI